MDYSDQDWNAYAKSLKLVPDEALRHMLAVAPHAEVALGQWEEFWKQSALGLPIPNEAAMKANRAWREIFYAFTRAEAASRGWELP